MKTQTLTNRAAGQSGFTLLELLVVITLIATLATAALVAYEDIDGQDESNAYALAGLDRAIRTYRAEERKYPNQWDSLLTIAGGTDGTANTGATVTANRVPFLAEATEKFITAWTPSGTFDTARLRLSLVNAGIEELQFINEDVEDGLYPDVVPNTAHNESTNTNSDNTAPAAIEVEFEDDDDPLPINFAVIPTDQCSASGETIPAIAIDGETTVIDNAIQNALADTLEGDECHLVLAFGFGGDAAASTLFSRAAISKSALYTNDDPTDADNNIDPATQYARYIGLFHIAELNEDNEWEFTQSGGLPKARLLTLIAPDGKSLDQLASRAQQ